MEATLDMKRDGSIPTIHNKFYYDLNKRVSPMRNCRRWERIGFEVRWVSLMVHILDLSLRSLLRCITKVQRDSSGTIIKGKSTLVSTTTTVNALSDDGIQIDSIVAISNGGILVPHGICNFVIYRTANRKDANRLCIINICILCCSRVYKEAFITFLPSGS